MNASGLKYLLILIQ